MASVRVEIFWYPHCEVRTFVKFDLSPIELVTRLAFKIESEMSFFWEAVDAFHSEQVESGLNSAACSVVVVLEEAVLEAEPQPTNAPRTINIAHIETRRFVRCTP